MSTVSQIKALVFHLAPKCVQTRLLSLAMDRKMAHWEECYKTVVSKEEVDSLFSRMSLDCDVMVHSSLPDIGNIKLRYVTDNIKKHILDEGYTVLCPALPVKGSSLDYLRSIHEFDVRTAPNAMGAISVYFGRQKDALRSLSPTHSVIAIGKRASYYTEEHSLAETPFSEFSPYYKLLQNKGKILMFGAPLKNLTFCHVIEDMIGKELFPVKVYDSKKYEVELVNEAGVRTSGSFYAHSHRSSRMRDTTAIMEEVRRLPSTKVYSLGCSEVLLLDAKDVCLCFLKQLKSGLTTFGRRRVSEECKRKADYWIDSVERV